MKHLTLLCSLSMVFTVQGQWVHTNNPNTQINCITAQGNTVLAGSAGTGVFVSNDQGDSWLPNTSFVDFEFPYIWCTAIDGANFYAGTGEGIYRSSDQGASWVNIGNGITGTNVAIFSILFDGPTWFTGSTNGLFRSTDAGANWAGANSGLLATTIFTVVRHGSFLFAGTGGTGIFRSSDGGDSWTDSNNGLTTGYVRALLSAGDDLYAGTDAGVFRSVDNGANWSPVNNGILSLYVQSLLAIGNFIYAGTPNGGIYMTTNQGASWTTDNVGLSSMSVTSFAANDDYIYSGASHNGTVPGDVYRHGLPAVGLSEHSGLSSFNVFPTLSSGPVTIEDRAAAPLDRTVRILDATGRLVTSVRIGRSQRATINLDGASGLYIIEIASPNDMLARVRLVKEM